MGHYLWKWFDISETPYTLFCFVHPLSGFMYSLLECKNGQHTEVETAHLMFGCRCVVKSKSNADPVCFSLKVHQFDPEVRRVCLLQPQWRGKKMPYSKCSFFRKLSHWPVLPFLAIPALLLGWEFWLLILTTSFAKPNIHKQEFLFFFYRHCGSRWH